MTVNKKKVYYRQLLKSNKINEIIEKYPFDKKIIQQLEFELQLQKSPKKHNYKDYFFN